ncbi:MAG: hypothetical protein KZQ88_07520 [Candidatus Thiodiazotropha sp. (ex Dulcina madagascariensis)]|nr:hypothetical protein [Candidatus Thiodiazotropha sp. (ex Epidulcina cf. delphinae)]MCU7922533.1 hypothetical protein [Candidatus Thiodiazotropha sp. (ex Dulcina madagascariensis)]MCU7925840.1 hypothetical protein [Candidatus Thiodiazotropha sp. (ex Dulcina madagascariensis)]
MAILIKSAQVSDKRRNLKHSKVSDLKDKSQKSAYAANNKNKHAVLDQSDINVPAKHIISDNVDDNYVKKDLYLKEKERADVAESKLSEYEKKMSAEKAHAIEQGYNEGFKKGSIDGKDSYNAEIINLTDILLDIKDKSEKYLLEKQGDIVEVIFLTVSKIIGDAVINKNGIQDILKRVIRDLNKNHILAVRVSPEDYSILNKAGVMESLLDTGSALKLIKDDRIIHGGCIVESQTGSLDARLETQFEILKETLLHAKYQHDINVRN